MNVGARGGQNKAADTLELGLQPVLKTYYWVMETKVVSSAEAVLCLYYWAISPAPGYSCYPGSAENEFVSKVIIEKKIHLLFTYFCVSVACFNGKVMLKIWALVLFIEWR